MAALAAALLPLAACAGPEYPPDGVPACHFGPGAMAETTLGLAAGEAAGWPIDHVLVLVQENRSFDHYFGRLAAEGLDVDGIPEGYLNADRQGMLVQPHHLTSTCVPDPPHQWMDVHRAWHEGKMDGFYQVAVDGHDSQPDTVLGWYDRGDLPFYYWLATTFAISDRYFSSALAGTWPNRDVLYAGGAWGLHTNRIALSGVRTVFDALTSAGVSWKVYSDRTPFERSIGWKGTKDTLAGTEDLLAALAADRLPQVSVIDAPIGKDEHPDNDSQVGEAWVQSLVSAVIASPAWPRLVFFFTYDEGGGFFDHVPPPHACRPTGIDKGFDVLGIRVPFVAISPYARSGYVSHVVAEHASILRFIEARFGLGALTARDANAGALLDLFDFSGPGTERPVGAIPAAGSGGCPVIAAPGM
jgi:phospholipase C